MSLRFLRGYESSVRSRCQTVHSGVSPCSALRVNASVWRPYPDCAALPAALSEHHMKRTGFSLIVVVCCLAFAECAHKQPLISHAHVGHGLTHWTETPDNKGLFQVAHEELETARREAEAALASNGNVEEKTRHIANVSQALSPGAGAQQGPGLGYGAVRALEAAVEHLEYAATSEDASANVVSSVAPVSEIGLTIVARLRASSEKARAARDLGRD